MISSCVRLCARIYIYIYICVCVFSVSACKVLHEPVTSTRRVCKQVSYGYKGVNGKLSGTSIIDVDHVRDK